ncbi:hypothetical protein [Amphritea sp. HPY]|uniref:hypothetical protein n=1 Tax=Amphritea sp. HPY TaxID=3421652 RepID=UPI003D7C8070
MKEELLSIIIKISDQQIEKAVMLSENMAFMPPGHNGPYFDIETPIRSTSHWLVTYSVLYSITNESRYRVLAILLANFLVDAPGYVRSGVFIHRQKKSKDWCNGVIGQAWVIEALVTAGKTLERPDLLQKAKEAALSFRFDRSSRAWKKKDPCTSRWSVDYTLNHQLWFAAAISEIGDPELRQSVEAFMDGLSEGALRVHNNGLISHLMYKRTAHGIWVQVRYAIAGIRNKNKIREKEYGYHLYNLHPLARLFKIMPDHPLFSSEMLKSSIALVSTPEFLEQLSQSAYAYPYNAPAFELPLLADTFGVKLSNDVAIKQINEHLIESSSVTGFINNCPDSVTLNARIYEYLIRGYDV